MDPKKTCPRCEHLIDSRSRVCPYCNQEQLIETLDGEQREVTESSPAPTSPIALTKPRSMARQILFAVGGVALLIGMFFIGWLVYAWGQPDALKKPLEEEQVDSLEDRPAPDVTLVADGSGIPDIERAYTSRLAETLNADLPEEFQRRDATALPIAVYQRVAEEERRREQERRTELVDPREVTESARPWRGRPVAQPTPTTLPTGSTLGEVPGATQDLPQPAQPDPGQPSSADESPAQSQTAAPAEPQRTKPRPLSQPLPRITSRNSGTVHVSLTVGADGEVANVRVLQGMPGVTPQVVSALNRWKFQPATVNGQPVESNYQVEIVVKPNR